MSAQSPALIMFKFSVFKDAKLIKTSTNLDFYYMECLALLSINSSLLNYDNNSRVGSNPVIKSSSLTSGRETLIHTKSIFYFYHLF